MQGRIRLSKKWFARKSCTKEATCMPAGSGHGFVQLVSCGLHRFPLAESCKNASVLARECSFLTLLVYDKARRSRISRSAEGLTAGHTEATQGAALDLQGASPLTHNPWQRSIGDTSPREGHKDFSQLSRERKRWNFICATCR